MRILFITENFPPEVNAAATRVYERACYWVKAGHEVIVLTCFPNFPQGRLYPGYRQFPYSRELIDGIVVIRLPTYIARNEGFLRRILDFVSFMLVSSFAACFVRRPDVVVATSPQFFAAVAGRIASVARRRPFVFELSDLWPASIVAVGAMSRGVVYRILERLELHLYRRACAVVALTDAFRQDLVRRGIESSKIAVVINGVDLSRYTPQSCDEALRNEWGLAGKFVLGYVGTQGMAHGLTNAVEAAALLRDDERFRLLFVGTGAVHEAIRQAARDHSATNIVFAEPQPKARMPAVWSVCDVALIHLRDDPVFADVIPSKMFEAMGMGLPLLLAAPEGEASRIVSATGAGICVRSKYPGDLERAVRILMNDADLRERLSRASLAAAPTYSRERQARDMMSVLEKVTAQRAN